jgi:hypothetical protein
MHRLYSIVPKDEDDLSTSSWTTSAATATPIAKPDTLLVLRMAS